MAPASKATFYREGQDWFCDAGLSSDVVVTVDGINFHAHKFPLIARCGKIVEEFEEAQNVDQNKLGIILNDFPGGPDVFLVTVKFCYGIRFELTPRNIILVYCAADYLKMTDEYGKDNLLSKSESLFHKNILRNWKDCILALQSSEPVIKRAEELQIITKCLNSVSMMVCTDPSLFGWPMKLYGSLQSPGGSILWNGINTGARLQSSESDWWFDDISYLNVELFEKLIFCMESKGIRPDNLSNAIMYYARKHLPGLGRWQNSAPRTVISFSLTPASVDQRVLIESISKLLPRKKGKRFCRFLLGLLRVALILGVSESCQESLEKRIGMQLELATLDSLLIPTYSASDDTLYNTDCVERMIHHFKSSQPEIISSSPASLELEASPSSGPLKKVARLIDNYTAEVASDVNLKPGKFRALAEAVPESARSLYDGLYRALDIYFKEHPWLPDKEKEQLCNIIDFHKLSIDACAHASQNERLPLRVILQVLFCEQLQLRSALASCLQTMDAENITTGPAVPIPNRRVINENRILRLDMLNMRSRVGELEEEFSQIKQEMKRVADQSRNSISSPRFSMRLMGCSRRLLPRSSNAENDVVVTAPSPRASVEKARSSHHSGQRTSTLA
ncbi:BTB/POZ domain-containing protein At3g44820 [Impatiens glandulifera]|uniref:BTB/POZ domain-containing protein At3g44820 n=1 Tax=Impatiens glandulifera TaxID=253017 RepID=UPI001FB083B8|nr:BTB/POZ domain-containing protein At3g44820 [Impatiens glandulifera]